MQNLSSNKYFQFGTPISVSDNLNNFSFFKNNNNNIIISNNKFLNSGYNNSFSPKKLNISSINNSFKYKTNFKFFSTSTSIQKSLNSNLFLSTKRKKNISNKNNNKLSFSFQLQNLNNSFNSKNYNENNNKNEIKNSNKKTTFTKNTSNFEINGLSETIFSDNKIKKIYVDSIKKNLINSLQEENTLKKINNNNCNNNTFDNNFINEINLNEMVDFIISSTKKYNRYLHNNKNIKYNEKKKTNKEIQKNNFIIKNNFHNQNNNQNENEKIFCNCKKIECLKFSCVCLKKGNKCKENCFCKNCKNK